MALKARGGDKKNILRRLEPGVAIPILHSADRAPLATDNLAMSDRIECARRHARTDTARHMNSARPSCEVAILELLLTLILGKPLWMWLLFLTLVLGLLAFDLGVLHRDDHEIGVAESLRLSAMYVALGLAFSGFIWWQMDGEAAAQYLTAFVVEKTLAMDNIMVIALIFAFFAVPRKYQHRVLFWGILGVIVLRGIMIGLGATIVEQYHWVLYVFAAFLILTGLKLLFGAGEEGHDLGNNRLLKLLKRRMHVTDEIHGHAFFIRQPHPKTGRPTRFATPLFLALILIECADLIFAVDSIPAVFTITTDP